VDPGSVQLVGPGASTATVNALHASDVQVIADKKRNTCTLDFRVWNSGFLRRQSMARHCCGPYGTAIAA
jgi:hypothetical protein